MPTKYKMSLVALFVLFFLLFNAPFLTIPSGLFAGIPRVMIYIGACWIILIAAMGMISIPRKNKRRE